MISTPPHFARAALLGMLLGAWGSQAQAAPPTAITIPGDKVFPESTTSTADGTIYVGSLASGGIMKVAAGSDKAEPWIKPGAFETRSIFGLLADEESGTLWACSNDASPLGVAGPSDTKGSALKGFDLKTGEGKVSAPLPGPKTLCNDMAIGPDKAVYVTNSLANEVLRLAPGAKSLEVWAKSPLLDPPAQGAGLDGIAFDKTSRALYVDTFNKAELFRIDVNDGKAGKITKMTTSRPLVLADALRPIQQGDGFLLIEGEGRLDRVTMSGDQAKIETLKDGLNTPTGVAQVGSVAWVSEGQLPLLFGGQKKPPALPFSLKAVPIPTP